MKILIPCEYSGRVREAFRKKGHEAWSCDLLPSEIYGKHYQGDVFDIIDNGWDMMITFPPCTDLSSSGARWWKEKQEDGRQQKSIEFFLKLARVNIPKIAIENPVGIMSRMYRKPDQYIQPFEYGHAETKKTCLWLKGLPDLKPTNIVEPDFMRNQDGSFKRDKRGFRYSRTHFMSYNNPDRAKLRSLTFQGWADAMADQWGAP